MRLRSRLSQHGIALITALLFSFFLLGVGLFFLTSLRRDVSFQTHQDASRQAYYLALSGIDYYRHQPVDYSLPQPFDQPAFPQSSPAVVYLDSQRSFEVFGAPSNSPTFTLDAGSYQEVAGDLVGTTIVSTGRYHNSSGAVIARRTLVVPQGLMSNVYER